MFKAKVEFWGVEKGGRSTPPGSGFHPQVKIGNEYSSCTISGVQGVREFEFNKEYEVELRLMFMDIYEGRLRSGDHLAIFEGSKQIGAGTVIADIDQT